MKDPQTTTDEHHLELYLNIIEQYHWRTEGASHALFVMEYHLHTQEKKGPQGTTLRYATSNQTPCRIGMM